MTTFSVSVEPSSSGSGSGTGTGTGSGSWYAAESTAPRALHGMPSLGMSKDEVEDRLRAVWGLQSRVPIWGRRFGDCGLGGGGDDDDDDGGYGDDDGGGYGDDDDDGGGYGDDDADSVSPKIHVSENYSSPPSSSTGASAAVVVQPIRCLREAAAAAARAVAMAKMVAAAEVAAESYVNATTTPPIPSHPISESIFLDFVDNVSPVSPPFYDSPSVRRRLQFSPSMSNSPVSLMMSSSNSHSSVSIARACQQMEGGGAGEGVGGAGVDAKIASEFVGECVVCYVDLPMRSNHIFTRCGHLFCVKCLFVWNEQKSTCPLCRMEIYQKDAGGKAADGDDDDDSENDDDETLAAAAGAAAGGGGADDNPNNIWNNRAAIYWDNGDGWNVDEAHYGGSGRIPRYLHRIDNYLHDDDEIQWSGSASEDDELFPLSRREAEELRDARRIGIQMIRRHTYQTILLSDIIYNGEIIHTFIPKDEYLEISNSEIGRQDYHFYEFVMARRESSNPGESTIERNFFGFITEITVIEVRGANLLDRGLLWEDTHEYCFVVEVFDPLWRTGISQQDETLVDSEGVIDISRGERMNLRFSEVRRLYSVWPHIIHIVD